MNIHNEEPRSPEDEALAQREAGDLDGAIRTLIAATEQAFVDVRVVVTLGQMLLEGGEVERAEGWLRHAMKLDPDDMYARMVYGTFLGRAGRAAEGRAVLGTLREEVRELRASPDPDERAEVYGVESFIACTEVNLARAALESGDSALARELVGPWLSDAVYWGAAHGVLADLLEQDDLDPVLLAEEGLASGQVSPFMVCHLLEVAVDAEPCDFATLERVISRADACFAFDWKRVEPEIEAVLGDARQRFAHAVMRGQIEPTAWPALETLGAQVEGGSAAPGGPWDGLQIVREAPDPKPPFAGRAAP